MDDLNIEQQDFVTSLRSRSRGEIKALFRDCDPPELLKLRGEFKAMLLSQGNAMLDGIISRAFKLYGDWTGKAFCGTSETTGFGYNCFASKRGSIAKLFMDLRIGPSSWTSGDSMYLEYGHRNRGLIRWLEGEVRQAMPGVLLGFGSFGIKVGQRDKLRRRIPFLLYGPTADFRFASDLEQQNRGEVSAAA